jgi:hypothetical protein
MVPTPMPQLLTRRLAPGLRLRQERTIAAASAEGFAGGSARRPPAAGTPALFVRNGTWAGSVH